jgi:hypothetical protein
MRTSSANRREFLETLGTAGAASFPAGAGQSSAGLAAEPKEKLAMGPT